MTDTLRTGVLAWILFLFTGALPSVVTVPTSDHHPFVFPFPPTGVVSAAPDDSENGGDTDNGKLDLSTGQTLYERHCATCHGEQKQGRPPEVPPLTEVHKREHREWIRNVIRTGAGIYHEFDQQKLPDRQLQKIIDYLFGEDTEEGRRLYFEKQCKDCHQPDRSGIANDVPALVRLKKRSRDQWLYRMIKQGHAEEFEGVDLSDEEREQLIRYLYGKPYLRRRRKREELVERGKELFDTNCARCHRRTVYDDPPENLPGDRHHPSLPAPFAGAAERYSETVFSLILDRGPGVMPTFRSLSERDRKALRAYAASLNNRGEPKGPTLIEAKPEVLQFEHPGTDPPEGVNEDIATTKGVARKVQSYVERVMNENDGVFPVRDEKAGTTRNMVELKKIHKDRLSTVKDGRIFACVDMQGEDGKTYDVDFFFRAGGEALEVEDTFIHKVDGTPRYKWIYKNGYWTKRDVRDNKQKKEGEENGASSTE